MSGIPSWARRGAKVVRVPWTRPAGWPPVVNDLGLTWRPVFGEVYTISLIDTFDPRYCACVALKECPDGTRQVFPIGAFRPLVDESDEASQRDVALFTHHLARPAATTTRERSDA